ncbi:MAG TPA: hypothetical protein VII51_06345 [Gaiellaceae bacterium]
MSSAVLNHAARSAPAQAHALTAALAALVPLGQEERPSPAREPVTDDSTEKARHAAMSD